MPAPNSQQQFAAMVKIDSSRSHKLNALVLEVYVKAGQQAAKCVRTNRNTATNDRQLPDSCQIVAR